MDKPNINLATMLLDLIESGEATITTKEIADFKKKTGKIYVLLDELNPSVLAAVAGLHDNCAKTSDDLIKALEENEALKKELQKSRLPVDDGNLAAPAAPRTVDSALLTLLEDYEYFLPRAKIPELLKQFDEGGGDIKILIHRTTAQTTITTQAAKLDILPPNTKVGDRESDVQGIEDNAHILTEQEYARLTAGETLEEVRGSKKTLSIEEKAADFSTLKQTAAPVPVMKLAEPIAVLPPNAIKPFSLSVPINRDMSHAVVLSIIGNWVSVLPEEIRKQLPALEFEPDTVIHHARNRLALRFLESGNEWSLWLDSDIIAPNGNPAWFKRRSGFKHADEFCRDAALKSLTRHEGKKIVSACYIQRSVGGRLIAQPGLSPRSERDEQINDAVKQGPRKALAQVDWVGFGCVAVHRQVFLDILEKVPGVRPKEEGGIPGFFTAYEAGPTGEDIAFCKRALEAGHPSFLDLSVHAAHVGKFSFLP